MMRFACVMAMLFQLCLQGESAAITYTVRPGDSPGVLRELFGVTEREIPNGTLKVGEEINISLVPEGELSETKEAIKAGDNLLSTVMKRHAKAVRDYKHQRGLYQRLKKKVERLEPLAVSAGQFRFFTVVLLLVLVLFVSVSMMLVLGYRHTNAGLRDQLALKGVELSNAEERNGALRRDHAHELLRIQNARLRAVEK